MRVTSCLILRTGQELTYRAGGGFLAALGISLFTLLLIACDSDPAPTPTPLGSPPSSGTAAADYAQACGALTALPGASAAALAESDQDLTWGALAAGLERAVAAYSRLDPPDDLHAYHDARLRTLESFRDHAASRPVEDSVARELFSSTLLLVPRLLHIDGDESLTQQQKEQMAHEAAHEVRAPIYGAAYFIAFHEESEARDSLSEETRALLDEAGCTSTEG